MKPSFITNTRSSYGLPAIVFHWLVALLFIGLFALGLYMVDLDYYNAWYNRAPWWHKALGIVLTVLLVIRWCWRLLNVVPAPLGLDRHWQYLTVRVVHQLFYILLAVACVSGYFISTAKGSAIDVFDWFELPAIIQLDESWQAWVARIHEWSVYFTAGLMVLHSLAALKHHFINHDKTMIRILIPIKPEESDG
ncbi:MAG: cytochrome b [Gammaproteobacteria bacterium]|nr:cytochrome b [Gammaproteobacteria bacterium]